LLWASCFLEGAGVLLVFGGLLFAISALFHSFRWYRFGAQHRTLHLHPLHHRSPGTFSPPARRPSSKR